MSNALCGWRIASGASRLCRTHRGDPVLVDLNHVPSRVSPMHEASEAFRSPDDDRMGPGAGLDRVALFDLLVKKHVEGVPASP
jgi:hypothetical protein